MPRRSVCADWEAVAMPYVAKDISGQKFGAWTVVKRDRGKTVCGLHCEANLQLLAKELNHKKRHYVWPDMP